MGRLFVVGDTHGDIDIRKLTTSKFPIQNELTKEDIVIVMGDWGGIWYGTRKDEYMLKWWNNKPWTTFVVLGNHECYEAINKLPLSEAFGAPVRKVKDSIYIAESGYIYNLCGYNCLVVNGADSHDKQWRKENFNWWPEEQITQNQINTALVNLAKCGDTIDFLLTHTGGTEVVKQLGFTPTTSDYLLDQVINVAEIKYRHFCGHYHVDREFQEGSRHTNAVRVLYNDVVEISDYREIEARWRDI